MTRYARLLAVTALLPGPCLGVTIYRFGGQSLPPPPEAGRPGIVFRQMEWRQLGAGQGTRVQFLGESLGPLLHDPAVPLAIATGMESLIPLYDQDTLTYWTARGYRCDNLCNGRYGQQNTLAIDLDDPVLVNRIRVLSGGDDGLGIVQDVAVYLSTSRLEGETRPRTPFSAEVRGNRDRVLDITGLPDDQRTAALQVAIGEHEQPWQVHSLQVYARGPAHQASFTSDIFDAGRPAVWGGVRWSVHRTPGSAVSLATRGGDSGEILRYWQYTGVGDQKLEVTREEYDRLRTSEKAGTSYNYDEWSAWSARSDLMDSLRAPPLDLRPRRAFQFQLEFVSWGDEASRLDFLELRASDAAVSEAVGELDPIQVRPGAHTRFTYTLKAHLQPTDTGFDRLRIRAAAARLEDVLAVSIDDLAVPFTVESLAEDHLVIGVPRVGQAQSDALVAIVFQAQVLRYGAAFAAYLLDSGRPHDVEQPVLAGDARDDVDSDRLWIETTVTVRSVLDAGAVPAQVSPNGDGINDAAVIAYDLFETTGTVPVRVEVLDLAGRQVRAVHRAQEPIGHYEQPWDGRDDAGRRVPPGIYLFRVTARIGGDDVAKTGVLHVVY